MNPNISEVSSTQNIVKEMQSLFVNINEKILNYWGVRHGERACPLGCLKCNKVMMDFKEFLEFGPKPGSNSMFCETDAQMYFKLCNELETSAKIEGKSLSDLYNEALKPFREVEKEILKTLTPEQKKQTWKILWW
jgi:hypothetical protein